LQERVNASDLASSSISVNRITGGDCHHRGAFPAPTPTTVVLETPFTTTPSTTSDPDSGAVRKTAASDYSAFFGGGGDGLPSLDDNGAVLRVTGREFTLQTYRKIAGITDGTSNTLMIAETAGRPYHYIKGRPQTRPSALGSGIASVTAAYADRKYTQPPWSD
jgi:hypothetical protein